MIANRSQIECGWYALLAYKKVQSIQKRIQNIKSTKNKLNKEKKRKKERKAFITITCKVNFYDICCICDWNVRWMNREENEKEYKNNERKE